MTKHTLTLDGAQAKYIATVALSACSTDDITPSICSGRLTVDGAQVRIIATDRYRIHTAILNIPGNVGAYEVTIARSTLQWLTKNIGSFGRMARPVVTLVTTLEEDAPTAIAITIAAGDFVDAEAVTLNTLPVKGNFPPMYRLLENARAAEEITGAKVRADFIGKTDQLARYRFASPRLKFTKASETSNKPGPLLVTFDDPELGVYAEALIQPIVEPTR